MNRKSSLKNRRKQQQKEQQKERPHEREILLTQASQQMCGGIFKIVFAFRIEGRIREPSHLTSHLSSERLRYEHRLMPFCNVIAPPAVPYQQYSDLMNQFLKAPSPASVSAELFAGAFQCFDEAKRIFMMIPDPSQEVSRRSHMGSNLLSHTVLLTYCRSHPV